jgi:hypothetical protein
MSKMLYTSRLFLVFALALWPARAAAQQRPTAPARGDWSAVQALAPGEKLVVRTRDGDRIAARFVSASDILLVVRHDETDMSFARDDVRLVQLNRGKSRLRGALFGAAVGGGAGFATGSILYFPFRDDMVGATVPAFTALGAGVGAALGAALGKGNKNVTIYEAP